MTPQKLRPHEESSDSMEREKPSHLNALLNEPLFAQSQTCEVLRKLPLGFVDIGARGGVHDVAEPLAGVTAVLGFEADVAECDRLTAKVSARSPWFKICIEPTAIAGKSGNAPFNVLAREVNSSLLTPSAAMAGRYSIAGFDLKKTVVLPTSTLDDILFGPHGNEESLGEFMKLDAQGAELDILRGSMQTLMKRSVALIVEVEFCALYEEQPLFSEVELFLRAQGFTFFGFKSMSHRAGQMRNLLSRRGPAWQERLFHADAIFFKDPLSGANLTQRGGHALFSSALLLGYYDFALEAAKAFGWNTKELESLTAKLATGNNS